MNRLKVILLLAAIIATPKFMETTYTKEATVTYVRKPCEAYPDGVVYCYGDKNELYIFEGSEDWLEGDIAELTISDNGTNYRIDDDYVKKAIYIGYVDLEG